MTYKLVMSFTTSDGSARSWNLNYAKSNPTATNVKTLMNKMIENGSIFTYQPVLKKSAKLIETSETDFDLDD